MKKRNKFSLSHYKLFSGKMGKLLPIGCTEVLPGDSFQHSTSLFLRMAPLVTPVMHPVRVQIHHWFVPTRLLWSGWEDFITGGPDGLNVSSPPSSSYRLTSSWSGSLLDYLGLPFGSEADSASSVLNSFNVLPFAAYHLIYNEAYRDQDLEPAVDLSSIYEGSVTGLTSSFYSQLHDVSWARDYFTTARPWPQKGPQVTVPVTGVDGSISLSGSIVPNGSPSFTPAVMDGLEYGSSNVNIDTAGQLRNMGYGSSSGTTLSWQDPALALQLSGDSSTTMGSVSLQHLREAFALQRFEEHRALYGSRYVEYLRYLGIKSSDARLQRPEYLGGGKQTVQFSEVLQTAEGSNPVGTMRGHGIGAMRSNRYIRFFEEHGYVMSLMMVHPIAVYMQGQERMWSRKTKEDYWQKELEHIGQQEVYLSELYSNVADSQSTVFGYQNRYDEYRSHQSSVAGEFRTTLKDWHLAREFSEAPVLNGSFISGAPSNRVFASTNTDHFYCMAYHSLRARRLLSKFGNPI